MNQLLKSNIIKDNSFSLCFSRNGGYISFGNQDVKAFENAPTEVNIIESSLYRVDLNKMQFEGKEVDLKSYRLVLDSGTTIVYLPTEVSNRVLGHFEQKFKENPEINSKSELNGDSMPCFKTSKSYEEIVDLMPVITFSKDSEQIFSWYPQNYLEKAATGFCFGFTTWSSNEMLLGTTFFMRNNITFDLEKRKVYFREANCDETDFSKIEGKPNKPITENTQVHNENSIKNEEQVKVEIPIENKNVEINGAKQFVAEYYLYLMVLLLVLLALSVFLLIRNRRISSSRAFKQLQTEMQSNQEPEWKPAV